MRISLCYVLLLLAIVSCKKEEGCTDVDALNQDINAQKDDGSCEYDPNAIYNEPNAVYIYSVVSTPTTSERVTIKNNSGSTVDLQGWSIGDLNNPYAYTIPSGNVLNNGGAFYFMASTMGFQINDSGETIYLKNASGSTVDTWTN